MSLFLTADELRELTGSPQKGRQIEFLRSRRIRHWVNLAGHPVVPRSAIEGGAVPPEPARPNLTVLRGSA